MRFSLRLNNDLPPAEYVALALAAEAAGFDQFWISHDLFLRSAPILLAAVAQATHRIEIGTSILNPYTVNPAELAMLAATLDELSGGRFNLGLAAGAGDFLKWVGLEQPQPLAAMRETLAAVRALLRGERSPQAGRFLRWSEEAYLRFPPARAAPLYLGATSPGMLRLAGEQADGALPLLFPPEHYHVARALTAEGEARRQAGLGPLDFAACLWVSLAEDPAAAQRVLARKIAYYGPALSAMLLERLGVTRAELAPIERAMMAERDVEKAADLVLARPGLLQIGLVGGPEAVIARLEPLVQAGLRNISFGPPLGPDRLAAVELLGRRVLPHFRGG
ncbi:MAG: LLM class flavin-dependent oxidoreductase [Anaerolineales bacterium]|nr:LLM class flavin-dependent oxidoreductase [Anaerolineales bacterium]